MITKGELKIEQCILRGNRIVWGIHNLGRRRR